MYLFMLIVQAAQKNTLTVTPCRMGETMMKVYTWRVHMCVCLMSCDILLQKAMLELSPNRLASHVCVSNAFLLGTPLRLCIILTVRSRQECHQRSLKSKAADSGKWGHTQYVFVYANSAGCPEEHFDDDTLSHGRDDDEGIHMCSDTYFYVCLWNHFRRPSCGARIKSTQLTRKCMYCFTACKTVTFPLFLFFFLFCIRWGHWLFPRFM